MCPRTEEREGNGNFGLVEIKGATKPRERERRGTMALQSCTMWLPRREPHHPRTSRCTFDPSIPRACRDLLRYPQCPKRSTGFQRSRKTRVCVFFSRWMWTRVWKREGGWSHATRQLRDPSPPQADYREEVCASVPRVWKSLKERKRAVRGENRIFFLGGSIWIVCACTWPRNRLNVERKKMERNEIRIEKNIFVLTFGVRLWNVIGIIPLSSFACFSRRGESNCSESRRPWAVSMEKGGRMLIER